MRIKTSENSHISTTNHVRIHITVIQVTWQIRTSYSTSKSTCQHHKSRESTYVWALWVMSEPTWALRVTSETTSYVRIGISTTLALHVWWGSSNKHVLRNLRIYAISRLCCAFSDSRDRVRVSRLCNMHAQSRNLRTLNFADLSDEVHHIHVHVDTCRKSFVITVHVPKCHSFVMRITNYCFNFCVFHTSYQKAYCDQKLHVHGCNSVTSL